MLGHHDRRLSNPLLHETHDMDIELQPNIHRHGLTDPRDDEELFEHVHVVPGQANPRWGVHFALPPLALIFVGIGIALNVPDNFSYPRDGEPAMIMLSHGEEICGWPITMGGTHTEKITENAFLPALESEVFDVKVMASSGCNPVLLVATLTLTVTVTAAEFCDETSGQQVDALWLEITQNGKMLRERTVPMACQRAFVEDIWTLDLANLDDYDPEKRTNNSIAITLKTNVSESVAVTFDVMEYDAMGRHRPMIAAIILGIVYAFIFSEVLQRAICTLLGSIASLIALAMFHQAPHMKEASSWISETTLALLFGMIVILHVLADTGFLEYCAVLSAKYTSGSPWRLLLALSIGTGILSIFLPNLAIVALVVPVTVNVCEMSQLDPVPYVIMESIMSGIGSAMTMITNPPNVIIGQAFADQGVTMNSFLDNVGLGCLLTMPFVLLGMKAMFPSIYNSPGVEIDYESLKRKYPISDPELLKVTLIILFSVIALMFLSPVHGLDSSWFSFGGALVLLLLVYPKNISGMMMRVEWDTFFYLAGLFVLVEACNRMRLINEMGVQLSNLIEMAPKEYTFPVAIMSILWVVTVISAFLDTIPLCIALTKVIAVISTRLSLPLPPLAWALAFAACLGQNATIVGSANNVVAVTLCERSGYAISTWQWLKIGIPVVLITQVVITVYMYLRYIV